MRKADLVNRISEKTGIQKIDVLVTLESFFKEVKESLKDGENVYVRGFGSFVVKQRAEKIGRNIKKNTAIVIILNPKLINPKLMFFSFLILKNCQHG